MSLAQILSHPTPPGPYTCLTHATGHQQVHHTPDPLPTSVAPKGEGGIQCVGCGLWTFIPALSLSWGKHPAGELCLDSMLEGKGRQGQAKATRWVSGSCQGWCHLAESSAAGQAAGAEGAADGQTWASLGGKGCSSTRGSGSFSMRMVPAQERSTRAGQHSAWGPAGW